MTLTLSLSLDAIAAPSPALGTKNGGVAGDSREGSDSVEAPFRAAWPARVRAEARSSSAAALVANPCQTGVRRTSGKIRPQTLSPSIGEKRGEKTRRT